MCSGREWEQEFPIQVCAELPSPMRLCWILHLGSLCWLQRCLLLNTSVRSTFRAEDENHSVVQLSSQPVQVTFFTGGGTWLDSRGCSAGSDIHFLTPQHVLCGFWKCYGTSLG